MRGLIRRVRSARGRSAAGTGAGAGTGTGSGTGARMAGRRGSARRGAGAFPFPGRCRPGPRAGAGRADFGHGRYRRARRPVPLPAVAALALLGTVAGAVTVTGCGRSADGVRVEGTPALSDGPHASASLVSSPPRTAVPSRPTGGLSAPAPSAGSSGDGVDVLDLLRADPHVGAGVKRGLRAPCSGHLWPVDVAHGRLTGRSGRDLVVNVTSCADGFGQGSYVYRRAGDTYENVFAREDPPVHAKIDRGALKVVRNVYAGNEPMCCPSGVWTTTYVWRAGGFRELDRQYTERGSPSASSGGGAGPSARPAPPEGSRGGD